MTGELTSQGDCPKHGRWYGICHSCHADAERKREWEERRMMIIRIERLEAVARQAKDLLAHKSLVWSDNALHSAALLSVALAALEDDPG